MYMYHIYIFCSYPYHIHTYTYIYLHTHTHPHTHWHIHIHANIQVQQVHDACMALADEIRERRPHTIVLITPHGLTVELGMTGVYMNSWAKGSAEWSGGFGTTQVQCELDVLGSRGLLRALKEKGCKARGVECFGGGRAAAQLGWAEVVPMWFLDDILGFSRFVVVSQGVCEGFSFGELHCMTRSEAQSALRYHPSRKRPVYMKRNLYKRPTEILILQR